MKNRFCSIRCSPVKSPAKYLYFFRKSNARKHLTMQANFFVTCSYLSRNDIITCTWYRMTAQVALNWFNCSSFRIRYLCWVEQCTDQKSIYSKVCVYSHDWWTLSYSLRLVRWHVWTMIVDVGSPEYWSRSCLRSPKSIFCFCPLFCNKFC